MHINRHGINILTGLNNLRKFGTPTTSLRLETTKVKNICNPQLSSLRLLMNFHFRLLIEPKLVLCIFLYSVQHFGRTFTLYEQYTVWDMETA